MIPDNLAKQQTESAKIKNAERAKKWERQIAHNKILKDAKDRRDARPYLHEYEALMAKEIMKAIGNGENKASICVTYPKPTDIVLTLLVESLIRQKYRAHWNLFLHDNEGPDLYAVHCSW
jgi:hypothetical protein